MKLLQLLHKSVPHSSRPHRDEWVRGTILIAVLGCTTVAAVAIYQAAAPRPVATSMAAMLPQGALLTIESPDFASLLHSWDASPEQKSWLASDNYSVFSNSRLFSRLSDARDEFETAAKTSAASKAGIDGDFLTQVAGKQSIFAWYDVGNLEFIYITRVSAGQAANIALLKDRRSWTARQSAGATFYIRKSGGGPAAAAEQQAEAAQGKARTVAFAQVPNAGGDLLILATREDLIANALTLIHPAPNAPSLATEPWYTDAATALPQTPSPALHMVLNLDRIVPLPYFRSYWVQRNITDMNQYRAAVSDLYVEKNVFREERALLLKSPDDTSDSASYLATLAELAPDAGVFRAVATHDSDIAVAALEEKLLGRITLVATAETDAPDPTLEVSQSGSTSDLETRIDAPAPVTPAVSNRALSDAIKSAGLDAMLTYSTAQPPATAAGLWVPIHSAVILHGASAWNVQILQSALQQSLRGNLTASTLGIEFHPETNAGNTIYSMTGPKPLFFAVRGNLCFLSDDPTLLTTLLAKTLSPGATDSRATLIAGFDHTSQRAPYARLTTLIDGTNPARLDPQNQNHTEPPYFSGNLRSLSDSFTTLASERFTERRDGPTVRQTVTYQWQTP